MDLGSVHERTSAIFTVWLAQYAPAAVHGEEDRIMVSAQCNKHMSQHGLQHAASRISLHHISEALKNGSCMCLASSTGIIKKHGYTRMACA